MIKTKLEYMSCALSLAKKALNLGEVPIGAVVVDSEGLIIGKGFNKVEKKQSQVAHAEVEAIAQAQRKTQNWRLNGCFIYVSLEPCLMCLGLIQLSRIDGIIYGADSPLYGCGLSNKDKTTPISGQLHIESGVGAHESIALLKAFFKDVREKKKGRS